MSLTANKEDSSIRLDNAFPLEFIAEAFDKDINKVKAFKSAVQRTTFRSLKSSKKRIKYATASTSSHCPKFSKHRTRISKVLLRRKHYHAPSARYFDWAYIYDI